jgi:alpha-L-arabinofuranosidase
MVVLASTDLQAENSLGQPARVAPVDSRVKLDPADLRLDLQPQSVTVARLARVR